MDRLVSVLMSIYNEQKEWIRESIDSILYQSYKNIELIVIVDNPQISNEIMKILDKYNEDFENFTLVINHENIGVAESLNKAFQFSSGQFIARLDADDVSKKNRIELQMDILLGRDGIKFVGSNCDYINEKSDIIGYQRTGEVKNELVVKGIKYSNFIIHSSWIMEREVFEEIGGYRKFECSQDFDFLLRVISSGYKIHLLGDQLISYRIRSNSTSLMKSHRQYLIAKYIKDLYLERISRNSKQDSHSQEKLQSFLMENEKETEIKQFKRGHQLILNLKTEKKILNKMCAGIRCIFSSKYSREILMNSLRTKLIVR